METRRLWPARGWWLALAIILICAGALRYTGYNFSLPYIDHVDEASYNLAGRMIIDSGSPKSLGMQGYPPGIIAVNYFFIRLFQDPSTPPSTVLWMVRLVSVTFSMATILALALLAFRVATPLAGLLAAALWTFTPIIVEFSRYATADNFVTFFSILALFLVLTGTRFNRRHWIYAAIVSEILAILFKYQAIFLLPLIVAVPLWRLTDHAVSRRAVLREFVLTTGVLAVFFFWLIFLFPALEAASSPNWSASNARLALPSPAVVWANFQVVYGQLESGLIWLIGWIGLGALAWRAFRRQLDVLALLVVAAAALAWVIGVSFYGDLGVQEFRQFIAAGAFLYVLRALGLVGWVFLIDAALQRVIVGSARRALAAALVAIAALILGVPAIQASVANAANHTLPDRRNDLAHWMDISLPSGSYIAGVDNHKTFNRDWGGYTGSTQFPLAEMATLTDRPLDAWRSQGVTYAIISYDQYQHLDADLLKQLLALKIYPPSPDYRGPDMVVLRLTPIQHPAEGQLGPIHLVGYDLNTTNATANDTLQFTLYWQAAQPTDSAYVVYNHLIDAHTGAMVAQVDGDPLPDLRRPTTSWDDPAETLISRPFSLALAQVPPGTYQLVSGFYRRDSGERLRSAQGGEDRLTIAAIQVR